MRPALAKPEDNHPDPPCGGCKAHQIWDVAQLLRYYMSAWHCAPDRGGVRIAWEEGRGLSPEDHEDVRGSGQPATGPPPGVDIPHLDFWGVPETLR